MPSPLVAYYRVPKTKPVQNSLWTSPSVLGHAVALRRESPLLTARPPRSTKGEQQNRSELFGTFSLFQSIPIHEQEAEVGDGPVDVIATQIVSLFLTRAGVRSATVPIELINRRRRRRRRR